MAWWIISANFMGRFDDGPPEALFALLLLANMVVRFNVIKKSSLMHTPTTSANLLKSFTVPHDKQHDKWCYTKIERWDDF